MPSSPSSQTQYYPPPGFGFSVAFARAETTAPPSIAGQFEEVAGVEVPDDIGEVVEGGSNPYFHKLPGSARHSNLILKRGFLEEGSPMATWVEQTVGGSWAPRIEPATVVVTLVDASGQPLVVWTFDNAWPVKWAISRLSSSPGLILVESLELAYTGVSRTAPAAS
ncbi:MAG: phage tail protein [Proteobacteria bacterium]|nr:phage tail protein [Pseudomonadota bacterium]